MATNAAQERSQGISYQDLVAKDVITPPDVLTLENPYQSGLTSVAVSRYTSPEFHQLEMQKMWSKTWQMACREEEIPTVGDYIIYEIGQFSILVVQTPQGIKGTPQCMSAQRSTAERF